MKTRRSTRRRQKEREIEEGANSRSISFSMRCLMRSGVGLKRDLSMYFKVPTRHRPIFVETFHSNVETQIPITHRRYSAWWHLKSIFTLKISLSLTMYHLNGWIVLFLDAGCTLSWTKWLWKLLGHARKTFSMNSDTQSRPFKVRCFGDLAENELYRGVNTLKNVDGDWLVHISKLLQQKWLSAEQPLMVCSRLYQRITPD